MHVLLKRSLLTLGFLFGLLFAVGTAVLWYYEVSIWLAVVFPIVLIGGQYLIGPYIIDWLFKIRWIMPHEISPRYAEFVKQSCARDRLPIPRFGIIEEGRPNAFTYGHYPGDARLVITRGLVDMLSADEVESVTAHELGHIKHWDFVVMTIAALVPLILYYLFRFSRIGVQTRSRAAGPLIAVLVISYLAYVLSQYMVLFLSRVREYYADYHASRSTRNPNSLATALVTIAYGLARLEPPEKEDDDRDKTQQMPAFDRTTAMSSLSFFDFSKATHFAMAASDASGNFSPENMQKAMHWDLYNPWAKWFELHSTHPLPAKRIREIQRLAGFARQTPVYGFEGAAQDYRPKFIADLVVASLPYVGLLLGVGLGALLSPPSQLTYWPLSMSLGLAFLGVGSLIRTLFVYRSGFTPSSIVDLITETEVSHIRPIPAIVTGRIIGRGTPGYRFSPNLVIQDQNGFVPLIYRQPFGIFEFLFGWLRAGHLIGSDATVYGWYRRGPGPYIEMDHARLGHGRAVACHYYHFILFMSVAAILAGAVLTAFVVPMIGRF